MQELPFKPLKTKKSVKISFLHIALALFVLAILLFIHQVFLPYQSKNAEEVVFNLEKGKGLFEISADLQKAGLIKSKFFFDFTAMLRGVNNNLQAGTYDLSSAMSIWQILSKMSSGDTKKEKVVIIEGWGLKQIAESLEERGIKSQDFFEIVGLPIKESSGVKDFSDQFAFLKEKPEGLSLEGFLFPDTYYIGEKDSLEEIIKKILKNFDEKLSSDLLAEIESQNRTLFQVLTMASLLEKEVIDYQDKQMVAGILWKRLEKGWPLQVDATLTYLTGRPSQQLTKNDLEINSYYNTYKYYGLPLGPICNPGLESIKAAIYYKESPNWFYLTTSEDKAIFSQTLEEHAINKQKYLK